jgi:hypothetical protein
MIARVISTWADRNEASAALAEDFISHRAEGDKRLDRMERDVAELADLWHKTASKIDRSCGRHEPPDSDLKRLEGSK